MHQDENDIDKEWDTRYHKHYYDLELKDLFNDAKIDAQEVRPDQAHIPN